MDVEVIMGFEELGLNGFDWAASLGGYEHAIAFLM